MSQEVVIQYKQENITPFWQKLPFCFLFPFRIEPLIFMACLIGASALAGLAFGGIGLAIKGFLVYLGLRYSFNVLELFSKGRFEGQSVDYTLWGPEKRPAKLGLVIALFLVIGLTLGNKLVSNRIAKNPAAQEQVLARYKKDHAEELAQQQRAMEAFNKRAGLTSSTDSTPTDANKDQDADDAPAAGENPDSAATQSTDQQADSAAESFGGRLTRDEILKLYQPTVSDPLWFKLLPIWYWALMLMLSLMLPASAIVIALEDNFFKSLNPAHVVYLIKSMGSAFFGLWGFFLLIAGSRQLALTAGENWPVAVRFPVEMALATYLTLVLFALMGYALYQFHQELSLDVEVDFDSHRLAGGAEAIARAGSANAAIKVVESKDPLAHKVQALVAEGKVKEAIAEVKDLMRYDRFDAALNSKLHPLYVLMGDPAVTLTHGQQWITALTRAKSDSEALNALRTLREIDKAFIVEDADVILPLAQAAAKRREFDITVNLLRGFDKRFPNHKDTASIYFLGAKLTSEHFRNHEKAAKILRMVLTKFPEDAIAAEAKTYLSVLEAIVAQSAERVERQA